MRYNGLTDDDVLAIDLMADRIGSDVVDQVTTLLTYGDTYRGDFEETDYVSMSQALDTEAREERNAKYLANRGFETTTASPVTITRADGTTVTETPVSATFDPTSVTTSPRIPDGFSLYTLFQENAQARQAGKLLNIWFDKTYKHPDGSDRTGALAVGSVRIVVSDDRLTVSSVCVKCSQSLTFSIYGIPSYDADFMEPFVAYVIQHGYQHGHYKARSRQNYPLLETTERTVVDYSTLYDPLIEAGLVHRVGQYVIWQDRPDTHYTKVYVTDDNESWRWLPTS